MEIFTILIYILFAIAVVGLIVGVGNDAVNFLNSAIGSRVASIRVILIVASLGVLLGSTFSSGMMEVARNGLFNPGYFTFRDVMYIFLSVMLTNIILLDIYNSLGLPTSTTVSLVFELLGAALVAGIITSLHKGIEWSSIPYDEILNFSSAITIIVGIFLSILMAFIFGSIIQQLARITFTFSFDASLKKYGAIFSGLAISVITYFLLIKGAKGSSFITDDQVKWVMANTWTINFTSFVFWSIVIKLLMWWTNVNPLRIVVLLGTFALAMAFAGNDLVNFIGVAVGGYVAFKTWTSSGVSPDEYNMQILTEKFATPSWILLGAGVIMVITLWTNAKSRKVTETELSLGRQDEGEERFKSNWFSRFLVGSAIYFGNFIEWTIPNKWTKSLSTRFVSKGKNEKDTASFDLIRASVNLLVSSVLIAYGTSQKLPLSTTFVTFMVAMGSSFADRAWGRESAVYRVAGVMNVIAGWLMTAIVAFASSALVVYILYMTGIPGVFVLVGLAVFLLVKSHVSFARKQKEESDTNQIFSNELISLSQAIDENKVVTIKNLKLAAKSYSTNIEALAKEKKNTVEKALEQIQKLRQQNNKIQNKIIKYVRKMPTGNLAASRLYILMFDHMQDLYQSLQLITESCVEHISNFHSKPSNEYMKAAENIDKELNAYVVNVCARISTATFKDDITILEQHQQLTNFINKTVDGVIAEIQRGEIGNRIGTLEMKLLLETRDIVTTINNMYALYHDYYKSNKS